ncbi:MAG: hypothetical protein HYX24_04335 [Candidatus Aenigmarchaeota archaeon]|nr:hypothetical protein [Candidatus Aenigmarchaeota archaeon]
MTVRYKERWIRRTRDYWRLMANGKARLSVLYLPSENLFELALLGSGPASVEGKYSPEELPKKLDELGYDVNNRSPSTLSKKLKKLVVGQH